MAMNTCSSSRKTTQINEDIAESSRQHDSQIIWSGEAWTCNRQLKHYPAFVKEETEVHVHSFVWVLCQNDEFSPGYVEDMYENDKVEKMVSLRWFYYRDDILHLSDLHVEYGEVFITSSVIETSADCIDGIVAVLTPTHFEESERLLPESFSTEIFMCHRVYIDNEVKPFSLSTLQGYATQPILSTLRCAQRNNRGESSERVGGHADPTAENVPAQQPENEWLPKVDENVELLSQDSGKRGCWFRCKILRSSRNLLSVQYCDVDKQDGSRKLVEWVPALRVAAHDNIGWRYAGRLTVRPWPSRDSTGLRYDIGSTVDAWLSDGWWEGVVVGRDTTKTSIYRVYFPGEKKFLPVERKDMRVSKDWVENRWVNIELKSDIRALLSESSNPVNELNLKKLLVIRDNDEASNAAKNKATRKRASHLGS